MAQEGIGLGLMALALLGVLALATYDPTDPVLHLAPVSNQAGVVGASLAGLLVGGLGWGAAVAVGATLIVAARLVLGRGVPSAASRFWPGAGLLLAAAAALPPLLAEAAPERFAAASSIGMAGWLGGWLATVLRALFGVWGAVLISGFALAIGALSVSGVSVGRVLGILGVGLGFLVGVLLRAVQACAAGARRGAASLARGVGAGAQHARRALASLEVWRERRARRARVAAREPVVEDAIEPEPDPAPEPVTLAPAPEPQPLLGRASRRKRRVEPDIVDHEAERNSQREPAQEAFSFDDSGADGPFRLPDVTLFQRPKTETRGYDRNSLIMNSRILEKKLQDFGVNGRVVKVHPGPVITMYEYEPASGVKVNKIVNLADDLALALRALSIRIIAPLPGKSVVGIEVPNAERETVYIRDLLESEGFRTSASKLTLALGKDIFGNPLEADLARMPHLLVAGATGTGKSVFLNSLLCSLLCRAKPNELKLLLVDPKLLELSIYEGIPHLIADVVTNPKRAAAALAGILRKMEERYQMMSALQVRSIDQFNRKVGELLEAGETSFRLKAKPGEEQGQEVELRRLPYIVVVIDELADLMVVSAREVEESLQRLAQMARAAGIHLVLATQRPSVDVITGIIKANFPARISFQVSSRTDSRTVLDQNGAEHLLGMGDMLFLPPGTSKLQRVHGSFVSEQEVSALVGFLREQGRPVFDETLVKLKEESEAKEARGDDVDEHFDRAVEIVAETRNASISYLQRRLKIGYNRAARIVEQMEEEGMIGPQEGTKSREVFVRPLDVE